MLKEGNKLNSANLELRFATTSSPVPRFTVIVPRFGRIVVKRNRLKRILREHLRVALSRSGALDLVLRIRPRAYTTNENELRAELSRLLSRVHPGDK